MNAGLFQYNFFIHLSRTHIINIPYQIQILRSGECQWDVRVDSRIAVPYVSYVTFEMTHVHRVEAYDGNPETDIGFRESVADEVVLACEDFLELVEGFEERVYSCFVCL